MGEVEAGIALGGWCALHCPDALEVGGVLEEAGRLTGAGKVLVEEVLELIISQVQSPTSCPWCYPAGQLHPGVMVAIAGVLSLGEAAPAALVGARWVVGADAVVIWGACASHDGVSVLAWHTTAGASAGLVEEPIRLSTSASPEEVVVWSRGGRMLSPSERARLQEALGLEAGAATVALALAPERPGWEETEAEEWETTVRAAREVLTVVE